MRSVLGWLQLGNLLIQIRNLLLSTVFQGQVFLLQILPILFRGFPFFTDGAYLLLIGCRPCAENAGVFRQTHTVRFQGIPLQSHNLRLHLGKFPHQQKHAGNIRPFQVAGMPLRLRQGLPDLPGFFIGRLPGFFRLLSARRFLHPSLVQPGLHFIRRHPVIPLLGIRQIFIGNLGHPVRVLDIDKIISGRHYNGVFQHPAGPQGHIFRQGGRSQEA